MTFEQVKQALLNHEHKYAFLKLGSKNAAYVRAQYKPMNRVNKVVLKIAYNSNRDEYGLLQYAYSEGLDHYKKCGEWTFDDPEMRC